MWRVRDVVPFSFNLDSIWMWVVSFMFRPALCLAVPTRGVLPTVVRRVWSRNLVNEEALAKWGLMHQIENGILWYKNWRNWQLYTIYCLSDGFLYLLVELQQRNFSWLWVPFLRKIFYSTVRGQPRVQGHYLKLSLQVTLWELPHGIPRIYKADVE